MRTSTGLSLVSTSVAVPQRSLLHRMLATAVARIQNTVTLGMPFLGAQRSRRPWRQDLPWDVGMDKLAEQAHPTWIPRGW